MNTTPPNDTFRDRASQAIDQACGQLSALSALLGPRFPHETSSFNQYGLAHWPEQPNGVNSSWTSGFWTGLLWLAHELRPTAGFGAAAEAQLPSYDQRLKVNFHLDHHDLGFLFVPSCVAAHRITGKATGRELALRATAVLMDRYLVNAGVIQAWGELNDPAQQGRIIIDCLLNLPLLHWASHETGNGRYRDAAISHARQSQQYLVRPDDTTFHTFHFDPATGAPRHGSTAQGASDNSCWSRGQAWGIYGFSLNHRWAPDLGFLDTAVRLAEHFLVSLPPHGVAMWDLELDESTGEPWDSSASAIAVCGLLDIADQTPDSALALRYRQSADHILDGLLKHCAGWMAPGNGLLRHGVYSKPGRVGVDEASLWGDYFFLEALARRVHDWKPFWHAAPAAVRA